MTTSSIVCKAPAPDALEALASLVGKDGIAFEKTTSTPATLTITQVHPLTGETITTTVEGWTPCAKAICGADSPLWDSNTQEWIEAASQALLMDASGKT